MLTPEIIQKIKKLHFKSSRRVNSMMAGQYKSVFRGSGIEFEEVREYSPGDDVKAIDWKVSARMARPFIKLYCEDRELVIMLLIDMSASGAFGTGQRQKKEAAAEVASLIAFNAIRNNDKVGALLFTDQVEKYIPPQKGSGHVWRLIKEFFSFEPRHRQTDIKNALEYMGRVSRKRVVSFLISDFISPDFQRPLALISKRHEIIAVLLSDPGEFELPRGGIVSVCDLEDGRVKLLDGSHAPTRLAYERMQKARYQSTLDRFKRLDIDCIEVHTERSVVDALSRYFRRKQRKRCA